MAIPSFDVTIKGMALSTDGLTSWDTYEGVGLLTYGFVWPCPGIWYGPYTTPGTTLIQTTWASVSLVSTSWTLSPGATVSTTWTNFSTYNIEDC